jgi:very-short-patch-repair endonuclease
LIVEVDGYRYHRGRDAFESDRTRDVELKLRGYEIVLFTFRAVMDGPLRVASALSTLLSRADERRTRA